MSAFSVVGRLFIVILLGAFSNCRNISIDKSGPPNIIVFLVDDLGKEWVNCYGSDDVETPNVDALATTGMLFENVYCMPQCTPTRLTFLTGQYPFRHGWVNHWDVPRWGGGAHFDENLNPSVAKALKQAGYSTCIAGKWQIDDFRVEPDALTKAGFDSYCMWTGYESGVAASAERYQDPYLFTKEGSRTYHDQFGPDIFRDFIIDFIQSNREGPFFIFYPMVLTHTPFVNTPDKSGADDRQKHIAMVEYADKLTGEIVAAIDEFDLREETLIIWTTDNGTTRSITGSLNGTPVKGGKGRTLESGICVPFIANWKGQVPEGKRSKALIDFTDLYPSLLDLAGVPPAKEVIVENQLQLLDGKSFAPVLLGMSESSGRAWIMSVGGGNNAQLTEEGVQNQYKFRDRVIRNERYKLFVDSKRRAEGFYDLQEDPHEAHNLIGQIDKPELKSHFNELMQVVNTFPQQDSDPRYLPNPPQPWDVAISAKSQIWKL
ncbi:MAG: sulfatase-like hydrolase/transferase [Saprospiraceae bacterium]|nr:sulfatase-like hydrolase/transferase [Saprospiraceae bacterium]